MRKIILMLLLAFVSSGAAAEWVPISRDGRITFYIDPATTIRAGERVRMWNLFNFETAQAVPGNENAGFLSSMTQQEFDCRDMRYRILYVHFHAEKMGLGKLVHSQSGNAAWEPVPGDGVLAILWKFACRN
ncbi:MAG: hypothetical protein IH606_22110 [Burkholderiales bacterium]|nr:hypothetical protein [Burkholderiales bacterium]